MIDTVTDCSPAALDAFDAIIDVRSPSEFAEDHLPGAINLPVLSDQERAEVGTLYVQTSRFLARRKGAAFVSRNIGQHLDGPLSNAPKDFRPLIYCWRGGMRSGAMATVLSQVGWRVALLQGGYKSWRRSVVDAFQPEATIGTIILVDGQAGAGKTLFLKTLSDLGGQVLDLEAAAHHRGSIFGAEGFVENQPSQKLFETHLYEDLARFDRKQPIFVEAESSMIGGLHIPQGLWRAMRDASVLYLDVPLDVRTQHILGGYQDIIAIPDQLIGMLQALGPYRSKAQIEGWQELVRGGAFAQLTSELLTVHYDPLYAKGRSFRPDSPVKTLFLSDHSADAVTKAAQQALALYDGPQK